MSSTDPKMCNMAYLCHNVSNLMVFSAPPSDMSSNNNNFVISHESTTAVVIFGNWTLLAITDLLCPKLDNVHIALRAEQI